MSARRDHIPAPGRAVGLRGEALCGRTGHYGTGDHEQIRRAARAAVAAGDTASYHWCAQCLALLPPPPGRPTLGHEGHSGPASDCAACRLREAREARGLTQPQAAELLAASLRAYKAWERGEARVPPLALRWLVLSG